MIQRLLAGAALATVLAAAAEGQSPDPGDLAARMKAVGDRIRAAVAVPDSLGNHLGVYERLRSLAGELDADRPLADQLLAAHRMNEAGFLGLGDEALTLFDARFRGPAEPRPPAPIEGVGPRRALDVVLAMADTSRILIVNEAHHVAQHRVFTFLLLHALRGKGFTHFAAETLDERDTALVRRGYPTRATGYYTREPLYGDLVRAALRLGYQVVPYESTGGPGETPGQRELAQATHLRDRVIARDPRAKLLVHVGHQHVDESGTLGDGPPMAARLRELTGIDPVTIEQTKMAARAVAGIESPRYRWAVEAGLLDGPTVFVREDGVPWSLDPGRWDVTLFHPRTRRAHGRPDWLAAVGRRPVPLPAEAVRWPRPAMVEARPEHEGGDAIPVDRLVLRDASEMPALMLPPGVFRVRVTDVSGLVAASYRELVP